MKLKGIILAMLALTAGTATLQAENVVQAAPLTTTAGITPDDAAFISFEMTNEEANIIGLEFKVKLPDGMTFEDSDPVEYPPFELVLDRFPYTGRVKVYQHSVDYAKLDDGWWHVFISSNQLNPIKELSGEILRGYYVTDGSMAPGVYPIVVKDCKMAISGTQKAETADVAVSYVAITASGSASPLTTEANVDLSSLTGYVPSFVVEQLGSDLAANEQLRSVNLGGATELGAELTVKENVVWWTSKEATLNRTFKAGQWQTVCLPFAMGEEQVSAMKEAGCSVEQLTAFDASKNTVTFSAVDAMEANRPYIVKTTDAAKLFSAVEGASVASLDATSDVTQGNITMHGTYTPETLSSDDATTYFAYDDSDGSFVRIGSNATVAPFRAYLKMGGAAGVRRLTVFHDDGEEGVATAISPALYSEEDSHDNAPTYNLSGQRIAEPRKGVYVRQGKKIIK